MKKLIGILAVCIAMCLCMTAVSFAATADIVHQSVEGTAVIDGTKDDAYANALTLPFIQKGESNGGGEVFDAPQGTAYIINDAEWVYVYFEVYDSALDNTSANNYEQDSIEAFWMVDNSKTQIRYHYDGVVDADSGTAPVDGTDYKAVTTDNGYAVELRLPITDVKANQIEMCLQINACTDGKRDCTIYIEGNAAADNAYQRSNRQTEYDVWWTLALAGDHADSRVDPEEKPMELTAEDEAKIAEIQEYIDRVEAAKTVLADTTADAAAKQDAADDAKKAANRALKEVEGYPNATAMAQELVTAAEELVAHAAEAKAAEDAAAAEANKPAEDAAPAEDENKPAATDSEGGSNTGLIVGIIIAVVVVAIIAVVAVLGKKKKA